MSDTPHLELYDNYKPAIAAGRHRLVANQTVDLKGGEVYHYYREQELILQGPRFTLPDGTFHSCYPPAGGSGNYRHNLPYLTLKDRALPWTRSLANAPENSPWLALLILNQAEWQACQGSENLKVRKAKDMFATNDQSLLLPNIQQETEAADRAIQTLDLPCRTFLNIAPTLNDLPYLAHLRKVPVKDKAQQAISQHHSYAVVMVNRLPSAAINHVLLVSLEGWHNLLEQATTLPEKTHLRLAVLHYWSFNNTPDSQDTFAYRSQNLSLDSLKLNVQSDNSAAKQTFQHGYTPLRQDRGIAWYRGPFTPKPADKRTGLQGSNTPGGEDISYAAAFQWGRLHAISSASFLNNLHRLLDKRAQQRSLAQRLHDFLDIHTSNNSSAETQPLGDELITWLARLALLYPVPYHYLIANPQLLPSESIRFFHIDNNWLHALLNGALSTAIQSRRDQRESTHITYSQALSQIVYQYRSVQLEQPAQSTPSYDYLQAPKSGFLLRSSLVRDMPGLEIDVTVLGDDHALGPCLRLDRISDEIMLGIYRGHLQQVTLKQPSEGFHLGFDSKGHLIPRDPASFVQQPQHSFAPLPTFAKTDAAQQVIDMQRLAQHCAEHHQQPIAAAALSLQLLRAPEAQPLRWHHEA